MTSTCVAWIDACAVITIFPNSIQVIFSESLAVYRQIHSIEPHIIIYMCVFKRCELTDLMNTNKYHANCVLCTGMKIK